MTSLLAIACGVSTRSPPNGEDPSATNAGGAQGSGGSSTGNGGPGSTTTHDSSSTGAGDSSSGGAGNTVANSTDGSDGTSLALPVPLAGDPIYTRVQRLTNTQWDNSVTDILGFDSPANLAEDFPAPVLGTTAFDNNELVLTVAGAEVVAYEAGAEAAAARATGSAEALEALYAGTDAEGFVQTLGRRAFRRPLTLEEEAQYQGVFALGETLYGPGFANGAALVIRAMLQSPHFLYRTELGAANEPLSGYELAAKVSLWLLDTTPSDALLDAAAAGELDSVEGLEQTARNMLETPAATAVMRHFHHQVYNLQRIANVVKDIEHLEPFVSELSTASYAFFDSVFVRDEGLRQILTSTRAYAGPALAPYYGVDNTSQALEEVDIGPSRTGYFMQVPFLATHGFNEQPDTIHRGFSIFFDVLCQQFPPPGDLVPPLPPAIEGQTNRERVVAASQGCGTPCHDVYSDQLGFAFEGFDGVGQAREFDNGVPIDASGSYPLVDGVAEYQDARELMQILAESSEAHTCYAKHMTGFGLGRDLVEGDRPLLTELAGVSHLGSLKEVIVALVTDPAFRLRQEAVE